MFWGQRAKPSYGRIEERAAEGPLAARNVNFALSTRKEERETTLQMDKTRAGLEGAVQRGSKAASGSRAQRAAVAGGEGIAALAAVAASVDGILQVPLIARKLLHTLSTLERAAGAAHPTVEQLRQGVCELRHLLEANKAVHNHVVPLSSTLVAFAASCLEAYDRSQQYAAARGIGDVTFAQAIGATAPSDAASNVAASTATSTSGSHELPPLIAFHLDIVASELSSAAHIAGHQSAADVIAQLGRWYPGDQLQLHDHLWLAFGHPERYVIVRQIMDILGVPELRALRKAQPGMFADLMQGPQATTSPTLLAYRDGAAAFEAAASPLADLFTFLTDVQPSRTISSADFEEFWRSATGELRVRLYLMFLLACVLGRQEKVLPIKYSVEAAVRVNASTIQLRKVVEGSAATLLAVQEAQSAQLSQLQAQVAAVLAAVAPAAAPAQQAQGEQPAGSAGGADVNGLWAQFGQLSVQATGSAEGSAASAAAGSPKAPAALARDSATDEAGPAQEAAAAMGADASSGRQGGVRGGGSRGGIYAGRLQGLAQPCSAAAALPPPTCPWGPSALAPRRFAAN